MILNNMNQTITEESRRTEKMRTKTFNKLNAIQEKLDNHLEKIEILSDKFQEQSDYFYQNFTIRDPSEMGDSLGEMVDKLWYMRHKNLELAINNGKETCDPQVWADALKAAEEVELKYGVENLSYDEFEWGMLNGKISALRWVFGGDWDELYT